MAWNEPGNKDENPWKNNNRNNEPPDLDELFRQLKQKFNGFFGGSQQDQSWGGLAAVAGGLFALWVILGFYTVDEQEAAVVLRFGKYYETQPSGLSWNPYFIDRVKKVNVTNIQSVSHKALMLTEDENIIDVKVSVQYRVINPKDFLLNVRDPQMSLEQATESALRHVVGSMKMDPVLGDGRVEVASEVKERIQRYMDNYGAGIQISQVTIDDAQPPSAVKAAFDNVFKAKEDQERFKNEAQAYANGVVPEAQGLAMRKIEEAQAYKNAAIARAEGEAQRFEQIVAEYKKAPEVTRKRLYLETMQSIMSKSSKLVVDNKTANGPMLYVPLDKMMNTAPVLDSTVKVLPTKTPESNSTNSATQRNEREAR